MDNGTENYCVVCENLGRTISRETDTKITGFVVWV